MANKLEKIFYRGKGRLIYKWVHYYDIYDRHFKQYRTNPSRSWNSASSTAVRCRCGNSISAGERV